MWLKRHPPMEIRTKYSRRLAKRLRERQAVRLKCRTTGKPQNRRRHWARRARTRPRTSPVNGV